MIRNIFIALPAIAGIYCFAQSKNLQYDAQLAQKPGADECGIKIYAMGFGQEFPFHQNNSGSINSYKRAVKQLIVMGK